MNEVFKLYLRCRVLEGDRYGTTPDKYKKPDGGGRGKKKGQQSTDTEKGAAEVVGLGATIRQTKGG